MTPLIALFISFSVNINDDFQPLRKRIDDRSAYAVQPAGHLVSPAAKFASCMQDCKNNFYCRNSGFLIDPNRNSTTVVNDRNRIVRIDADINGIADASQRFVYRIIDNFIDQMMQSFGRGTADIHSWSFPNRFQAL